ncbi:MAG: multifunctional CCA addition/repair protein [Pseudomonadota bacterium]|nr:multifunctional CCA addition/repair protein [Pseudomonadota bacterium]
MDIYMVGGAVRDKLLGLAVQDHDWVVVGATPEDLSAQGFLPVGKDFPVFLHPHTREEYALARTERNTARGYRGFEVYAAPEVTLEQDLARRDLTINAMAAPAHAEKVSSGFEPDFDALIDPYGGRIDLQAKVLRHVTDAFCEDPVRILRLARFAARFPDFSVAPETLALMQAMVADGEVDGLVPERVWQELSRGLMEKKPSRMFDVLRDCGALQHLLPEVAALWGVPQRAEYHPEIDTGIHLMMVLDMAAGLGAPLPVRFACLCHDLGKATTPADMLPRHIGHEERSAKLLKGLCQRLRAPTDCREIADVVAREHGCLHRSGECSPAALVRLLERCDAFRKPQRFADILLACECDARGRLGLEQRPYPQRPRLQQALAAAQAVATDRIAAQALAAGQSGPQIGQRIHQARVDAVRQSPVFTTPAGMADASA